MENIVNITYDQNGQSVSTSVLGMREMQSRAYENRAYQYILLKAPPASGKSRALMFIGLDKLRNQNIRKVIVTVPERSIGSSFATTKLRENGFFEDWSPNSRYDLCSPGGESRKVDAFLEFMNSEEEILICTHATLRFAFNKIETKKFNQCLVAIDEFHHVSADYENNGQQQRTYSSNDRIVFSWRFGSSFNAGG